MKEPAYVGIENEFQLMRKNEELDFYKYFGRLLNSYKRPYYEKADTSIRTRSGTSIYSDGNEPEVSTPPAPLEKGVATKTTRLLYLARKELVDMISTDQTLSLIGYSMHWNISDNVLSSYDKPDIMKYLAIPFSALCLNPLSIGIGLRKQSYRMELIGEHIFDEQQIKAFLNFFIGTMTSLEKNATRLPFYCVEETDESTYHNYVQKGRESKVVVLPKRSSTYKSIYVQDYLETYYDFFKKGIEIFATPVEMKNLEGFIAKDKKLEIDKTKKYAFYERFKNGDSLDFHPRLVMPFGYFKKEKKIPTKMGKCCSRFTEERTVPNGYKKRLEASFPGQVKYLYWDSITYDLKSESGRSGEYNIEEIYFFEILENLLSKTPKKEIKKVLYRFSRYAENYSDFPSIRKHSESILNNTVEELSANEKTGLISFGLVKENENKKYKPTKAGIRIARAISSLKINENTFVNKGFRLDKEKKARIFHAHK